MPVKLDPPIPFVSYPPEPLWAAVVWGAKGISSRFDDWTWLDASNEFQRELEGPPMEALAAFSSHFLVNVSRSTSAHNVFKEAFRHMYGPKVEQPYRPLHRLPRLLSCGLADGSLAMCGCIANFGDGMKRALFTPIFQVTGMDGTGAIGQFDVARAILQASLDAQYLSRRQWPRAASRPRRNPTIKVA